MNQINQQMGGMQLNQPVKPSGGMAPPIGMAPPGGMTRPQQPGPPRPSGPPSMGALPNSFSPPPTNRPPSGPSSLTGPSPPPSMGAPPGPVMGGPPKGMQAPPGQMSGAPSRPPGSGPPFAGPPMTSQAGPTNQPRSNMMAGHPGPPGPQGNIGNAPGMPPTSMTQPGQPNQPPRLGQMNFMNSQPGMNSRQGMSGPPSGPPGMMPPSSNQPPNMMAPPNQPGRMGPPSGPPGMGPGQPGMVPGQPGMGPGQPGMGPGQPGMGPGQPGMVPGQPGMTGPPSGPGIHPPPGQPGMGGQPGGMMNRGGYPAPPMGSGQRPGPPGPGQPMGMAPGPMSGPMGGQQRKIDPNQMPNPIQVMSEDQASFDNEIFQTSSRGKVPPLVSTKCRIQDDGNCSPRYMRSSVYSIPCNQDMLKESGIPMAIVTTPFAKIPEDEHQLRYVDQGPTGPIRCNRCKAYMNPFMQFIDGGRRFVCNICSHSSEVPAEYFCHLDHQGRRVDMYERPELCFGSYEYIATADYCKDSKLPQPPAFIFMIDVSYQSMQQGMVRILSSELHKLLDELPKDVGMNESVIKVGFVTYSTQLHFYNVKANLAQPQMMVVADLEDSFVPLLDGFLVDYREAKAVVDSLLEMLPEMFKDTRETDVVLGPVVAAGLEALKSAGISGKLYIFHSSLPITEAPGKLKNREDRKLLNTDKEKTILVPQGNYYMNMAKECVNNGVSIDLFLFPNSYVDVATIGLMVTQTGGQVYRYSYFKETTHGQQFVNDLYKNFKREIGFDAIMRLRCSTGLRPVEFFGSFVMNNTTDVELATIDSDKAIVIEIKHDDKIPEDGVAYVQNALLYTSASGQRRLRIHNLAFATCSQLADLYRCCELDTAVNYFTKYALRQVLSSNPQSIRENLVQKCVQILACYRQHCATPSTSGQLILPECMKLLPLYMNCLIKSDVLSGGSEISSDDRAFLMQACLSMPPSFTSSYLYPRVISLHTLDTDHDDDTIPPQMRCLGEKFEESGVYLLENTISMFLWIGLHADQSFISQVFGVNSMGQIDIEMTSLPALETPLSTRVREIIDSIQSERQRYLKLTIVRQRDKLEPWFKHYIVEDKGFNAGQMSYVDFLCHVHKEIRNLLS